MLITGKQKCIILEPFSAKLWTSVKVGVSFVVDNIMISSTWCFSMVGFLLLSVSMIPLTEMTNKESEDLVPSFAQSLHIRFYHAHVSHGYGLFRRMTGVGGRPEVVIQGILCPRFYFSNVDTKLTCLFLVLFNKMLIKFM